MPKLKKYIFFDILSHNNKSTVTRICRVQRYLNHVEIQINILGILWNGLKTQVTSSYQLCNLLKCIIGITATLCVDFILPANTSARTIDC
jgi:hypothetical protein